MLLGLVMFLLIFMIMHAQVRVSFKLIFKDMIDQNTITLNTASVY